MSDLGQDKDSLEIKVLELEHSIGQLELAKKNLDLQKAKFLAELKRQGESHAQIDKQIKDHKESIASIKEAIGRLK